MTTFMKTKFKKSVDQRNIDKYKIAVKITEYNIISKFSFLRITILKFMRIRILFHKKMHEKLSKISKFKMDVRTKSACLKWTYRLLGNNYRVPTFYPTISRIIILSLLRF